MPPNVTTSVKGEHFMSQQKRIIVMVCILISVAAAAFAEYRYVSSIEADPAQPVAGKGTGDSCAAISPKKKAIAEAELNAYRAASAKCNITDAQCKQLCTARYPHTESADQTLINEAYSTVTSSPSCGWHAESQLKADCGCRCSSNYQF
jgi:hypothetical protein